MTGNTEHPQRRGSDDGSFRHRLGVWWRNRGYRDVWLLMITAVMLGGVRVVDERSDRTRDSLCALRGDLEHRVASSTRLLAEHPNGIPGVTAKVLQDSIANQQRTVVALRGLDCPQRP